jgi:hypothetical protein
MRRLLLAVGLVGGCTWSNSLYQARQFAGEAERAERDGRGFEAQTAWDQAGVKADSALARASGKRDAVGEALWIRGRVEARREDCGAAVVSLDQALIAMPSAPWREALLLELGRCRTLLGDPLAAEHFAALLDSPDATRRREAHLRAGRLAVREQRYADALRLLEGYADTNSATVDRAVALSGLGRTDDALTTVAPLLAASDTSVGWEPMIRLLAARDTEDADRFLERLFAQPTANDARRSAWLLAAIDAGLEHDPAASERRFQALVTLPASRAVNEGRLRIAEYRVAQATSMAGLRSALEALGALGAGGLAASRIAELQRIGGQMVAEEDSLVPGKGTGDLTLFALAEVARDSLRAPVLAASLWQRLEQGWPASPYLPKAMIARMTIVADSAEALRGRLLAIAGSPYLAYARGESDPRFALLEDSLANFIAARARRLAAAAAAVQVDKE